ncbi:MAG: hypothetical protein HFE66_06825 [Clostridiales bacterium]|jgi:hypothetical protein|nr:hypothetical protein [Clostridiales bacterium]
MIREIRSGRQKNDATSISVSSTNDTAKARKKSRAADAAAIICAALCALSICMFAGRGDASSADAVYQAVGSKNLGAITYTPPEQPQEWSFWEYFADVMAGVFGYNG